MEAGVRAVLAGQITAAARHGDRDSVARAGELLRRQSNRRIRHVHDSADMVFGEPTCCDRGGDVDLVFVVAEKHADFFAERLTAKIFNSHVCGNYRALSGESGEEAGHIGQHADSDRCVGGSSPKGGQSGGGDAREFEPAFSREAFDGPRLHDFIVPR
jgi:hypothetical protein